MLFFYVLCIVGLNDVLSRNSLVFFFDGLSPHPLIRVFWKFMYSQTRTSGNETVDVFARKGSEEKFIGPEPFLGRSNYPKGEKEWYWNLIDPNPEN